MDTTVDTNSILGQIDDADDQGSGTGKGVFTKVKIDMGYVSFSNDQRLPMGQNTELYDPKNKDNAVAAEAALTNRMKVAGMDPTDSHIRPTKCVIYNCRAADVLGSTWKGDLSKALATYSTAWVIKEKDAEGKNVVKNGPAKEALKLLTQEGKFQGFGKEYFAHVKVIPSGRKDASGQDKTIWFVDNIFSSKEEMAKAFEVAGGAANVVGGSGDPNVPEGYTAELWAQIKPDVLTAIGDNWAVPNLLKVCKDYGLTTPWIIDHLKTA